MAANHFITYCIEFNGICDEACSIVRLLPERSRSFCYLLVWNEAARQRLISQKAEGVGTAPPLRGSPNTQKLMCSHRLHDEIIIFS